MAAPRIETPLPRSRMMVLGRAAKVKGHGELAGPGKGYSRVACDLRVCVCNACLSVCLPLVPWQASRELYVPSSCGLAALAVLLCLYCLAPSHHGLTSPHVI